MSPTTLHLPSVALGSREPLARPGLFARLFGAFATRGGRDIDEAAAHLIALSGGKVTDNLERAIGQRSFSRY